MGDSGAGGGTGTGAGEEGMDSALSIDALQWEEYETPEKDSLHKEEAVVNPQLRLEDPGGLHTFTTIYTSVDLKQTTQQSCLCSPGGQPSIGCVRPM